MKILRITPIQYNNINFTERKYLNYQQNYDSVSFQGKNTKINAQSGEKLVNECLKNVHGDLGTKVKELMANPLSRNVFTTTLIAMAAAVTELIVKNTGEIQEEKTEENKPDTVTEKGHKKKNKNIDASQVTDDTKTEHKKPGRKSIVDKMGEEFFIAKLKEMAKKDYTLEQMGQELDGMSVSSVSRYLKKYGIVLSDKKSEQIELNNTGNATEKSDSQEDKIKLFIEQNTERAKYIKELNKYPNLAAKYDTIIQKAATNPKDETCTQIIDGTEKILKYICGLPSRYKKSYFEVLNNKYSSDLNQIGIIANNLNAGNSVQEFLAELSQNNVTAQILEQWVQYPGFSIEELCMIEELSEDKKTQIHELKKDGDFKFDIIKDEEHNNYKYILHFTNKIPLSKKLKTISHFHEALYGNIYIHKDTGSKILREISLKQELLCLINKDKNLDSVYNILKFIAPDMLENCQNLKDNYSSEKNSDLTSSILRTKLEKIISNLNINNNTRMQDLEDLINDDQAFGDIIENSHAKLRFVSRFVLNKDISNKDLYEECSKALNKLERDMEFKLNEGCIIFPYINGDDTAPSFYLNKSKLGNFIKVTLNNNGQIHTIFEDEYKKNRRQKV